MKTNSIFTRVLALVLCMIMVAGLMTACFQPSENGGVSGDTTQEGSTEDFITVIKPGTVTKPTVTDPNHIYAGSTELADTSLLLGTLTNEVVIGGEEGVTALIPADVKVEVGASSLALSVKKVDEEVELPLGEGDTAQSLDVHIEGISTDNTVPMTVALGAILEAGLSNTELKLYHIEDGTPTLMTRVKSASEFAIHNQYVYNEETGEVTIYVASFSTFSMVKTSADVWDGSYDLSWYNDTNTEFTLTTAKQFAGFRVIVDGGYYTVADGVWTWNETVQDSFKGKTVTLGVDIDLNNIKFDPIGFGYTYNKTSDTAFMGTFDGGNHTIYNLYQNGWDLDPNPGVYNTYTYSTAGGGLFASIENATIKNLAMDGANIVFECVDIGIVVGYAQGNCHFENIVVTNSKIANYNRATGAVVGEVCYGSYGTDIEKGYSHTFKNIVVDSTVVVSSLWGSFDTLIGGVIGGKWGDATVKMENVITAAELDVYSDVTAAYQWYAYRRCGMLIGHTEQNSPKSALNADAPFLTCTNVNVYYGDWVKYNYYEFEEQDSSTGRRYPWVRAEASPVGNNGAFSNPRYGVPTHTVDGVTTKVTELSLEALMDVATDYTPIVFNQLYGGGQGVYGKADHDGVTTNSKTFKTIYVHNNAGWTNLKLQYWFANGNDTWTTIVDGIDMSTMLVEGNIYKIQLPDGAYAFKIVADGQESDTYILSDVEENITLGDVACEHTNTTTVVENRVESTCTVQGSYENVVKCADCGKEISRETVALELAAHNYNEVVTDPDCENKGYTTYTCTVCGNTYTDNHTDATGHTYESSVTKNPTCTETGVKTYTCSCGDSYTEVIPTVAHTVVVDKAVPATCTTAGKTEGSHCSVCNTVLVAQTTVAAKGHSYNSVVTAPTCTTDGYTTHTCTVCGDSYTDSKTNKLGHDWSNEPPYECSRTNCNETAPTKTVYFQNNWLWKDVKITYILSNGTEFKFSMNIYKDDSFRDVYSFDVPEFANKFVISGKNNTTGAEEKTVKIDVSSITSTSMYYLEASSTNGITVLVGDVTKYNKIYFNLGKVWSTSGYRYAAYFFNSTTNIWVDMTDADGDGIYECVVPKGYDSVIFCQMKKSSTANNWDNKNSQTYDLGIYEIFFSASRTYTMKLLLIPNSNWKQSNARFAAAFMNSDKSKTVWVDMTDTNGDGVYEVAIPDGEWKYVIFVRMNGSQSANNWNNKWNQTADLTIPTDGKYIFDIAGKASTWWDTMGNDCWIIK